MQICLIKNECSESCPMTSSKFLQMTILTQPPHCCDRTVTPLDCRFIFDIMTKSRLPAVSSFDVLFSSSKRLHHRFPSFLTPVSEVSARSPSVNLSPCALGPSCLSQSLTPSGIHALLASSSSPFLGPASMLESPPSFKACPSGLLSPYLVDLQLFSSHYETFLKSSLRSSASPTCLLDLGQTASHPLPTVF